MSYPVEVKVPVPVECPVPPTFEQINDPVLLMTPDTPIEDKIRDLRAARVMWRERAKQQETLLNAYRTRKFDNLSGVH